MHDSRLVPIAAAVILVLNLGVVTASGADAAQRGSSGLCVAISGGTVQNATVLDVVANGGTAIGDASGGNGNLAAVTGHDTKKHRHNRNDWSAESVPTLAQRVLQTETASAGNGGVASAAANGGAVSIGDINSGGNAGNAIAVGDTVCPGAVSSAPSGGNAPSGTAPSGNAGGGGGGRGGKVRGLPNTGVGELGGASSSLLLALGALGMMGLAVSSRLDRRAVQVGGRQTGGSSAGRQDL